MFSLHRPGHKTAPRRALVSGLTALVLGLLLTACSEENSKAEVGPKDIPMEELLKSGSDLPDLTYGPEDAKVTIVEYASLACSHCGGFYQTVFPELKKKYIDTGKVRFIFRDFPHNRRAYAAAMLVRCIAPDKSLALVETLFDQQKLWAFAQSNAQQAMFNVVKQAGFTQESFDKCLADDKLLKKVTALQDHAREAFQVQNVPTIIVNGKKVSPTLEAIEEALNPVLGSE